ncbi:MAG: peptidylprolyl isomerase, partial [Phycisphaerae bacterium]
VRDRLDAGEDFADLAVRYSANIASARDGGLLDPFSAEDDDLPIAFRETAFSLKPGEVSPAVRVGPWLHLIRLDELIPADPIPLAAVRTEVVDSLRGRLIESAMARHFEKLMKEATIEVYDAFLREAFHKQRPRSAP